MNQWTRVGVDEPGSRVEGGEPVLYDYGPQLLEHISTDFYRWEWTASTSTQYAHASIRDPVNTYYLVGQTNFDNG
jgi:hypothetical protein